MEKAIAFLPQIRETLKSVYIIMPTNDANNFLNKADEIKKFCLEMRGAMIKRNPSLIRKEFYVTTKAVFDENQTNLPIIKVCGKGV